MKKILYLGALLAPGLALAQLEWRISIKVFTDTGGTLPQIPNWSLGGGTLFQELSNGVNYANTVLSNSARGYSWRLTEIVTVPGNTAPLPASTNSWFNVAVSAVTQDDLDAKASSNAVAFQLRNNAINFYYSNGTTGPNGGYCAFPTENQNVILVAPDSIADVLIHESGHYFNLQHTHNTEVFQNANGTPCTNNPPCTCVRQLGGDDGVADTPLDNQCWTQNQVAQAQYGQNYASLNSGQQFFVDNTWLNVMSYHSPGVRFTDDQFDIMTDFSNSGRNNVATGFTRFVDRTAGDFGRLGTSQFPFLTVAEGISAANNGDIVLIRPGNYNEPSQYTKPVTLRATRGSATIGAP